MRHGDKGYFGRRLPQKKRIHIQTLRIKIPDKKTKFLSSSFSGAFFLAGIFEKVTLIPIIFKSLDFQLGNPNR